MSNAEIGRMARNLGHDRVEIYPTVSGRRFIVRCSCGWGAPQKSGAGSPTITRATFAEAVKSGQHHIRTVVQRHLERARSSGVSLGRTGGPGAG
jgi:hypothetical protein